jgi:imidazolonepropionase-like amidohydrolase
MKFTICDLRFARRFWCLGVLAVCFSGFSSAFAENIVFENAVVHTVSGGIITHGSVWIQDGKIMNVVDKDQPTLHYIIPSNATIIDLKGQHLYPGLIALNTTLGLTEIEAVRATRDDIEVGDYMPDVQSWIAVNPDSELIPVARANGIAYFEATPEGAMVSGQSALLAMDGWTPEQMAIKKPTALHVFWPRMELDTTPRQGGGRRGGSGEAGKSLDEQAKDRRAKVKAIGDFFDDAKAYATAKDAAAKGGTPAPEEIPAWEAMLPYVRGELPIVIHADEVRQIKSAVNWATTNKHKIILAGGRDAWMVADLLATNKVAVIFEHIFTQPSRDTESYDSHFKAPEILNKAGVQVVFGVGRDPSFERNLPYVAAQAVAFGLPEAEALKGITLYPAQLMGVAYRLGSIEPGKEATLFVCDGDILDIRSNVKQMWIAGKEVSLESRHTRLYEKYKNRPQPGH